MKFNNPRIERLREMMNLEEQRAGLQQQLDEVLQRMTELRDALFEEGSSQEASTSPRQSAPKAKAPAPQTAAPKGGKKGTARGALKERIMAALEAAGDAGVRVKELAQAIGTKPVNVHSWFHSSMKRYPAIKKIEGGHYKLSGSITERSRARGTGKKAKSPAKAKSPKGGRQSKRGELTARIISELENAGSEGINVRALAEKLGMNYKNIYIWFATTGKKNSSIKKVGPAQYRIGK